MDGLQGDIGLQVLHAVQALGGRMDRLEAQVGRLTTQVERLEQRMDRLEQRMDGLEQRMDRMEQRVDGLELQMERLRIRMDKQELWMERLGSEFIATRDRLEAQMRQVSGEVHQMRGQMEHWHADLQRGRQLEARVDHTASAVVLLAAELRGPTQVEYSQQLEGHLRELKVH